MRMHKKSRLEERLEECGDLLTLADLSDKNMKRAAETKSYLPLSEIFGNDKPLRIEIGCGKGKFACEMAVKNPDVNFVALEKISNVLIDGLERAKRENIKNIHFLCCAAEVLEKYFEEGAAECVYLNFSNPLPKEGYKKQRLTHPRFLNIYKKILARGGSIIQKTDDAEFFEFSLQSYKECGFTVEEVCYDYAQVAADDVETEHERMFKERGKKIMRAKVRT